MKIGNFRVGVKSDPLRPWIDGLAPAPLRDHSFLRIRCYLNLNHASFHSLIHWRNLNHLFGVSPLISASLWSNIFWNFSWSALFFVETQKIISFESVHITSFTKTLFFGRFIQTIKNLILTSRTRLVVYRVSCKILESRIYYIDTVEYYSNSILSSLKFSLIVRAIHRPILAPSFLCLQPI